MSDDALQPDQRHQHCPQGRLAQDTQEKSKNGYHDQTAGKRTSHSGARTVRSRRVPVQPHGFQPGQHSLRAQHGYDVRRSERRHAGRAVELRQADRRSNDQRVRRCVARACRAALGRAGTPGAREPGVDAPARPAGVQGNADVVGSHGEHHAGAARPRRRRKYHAIEKERPCRSGFSRRQRDLHCVNEQQGAVRLQPADGVQLHGHDTYR